MRVYIVAKYGRREELRERFAQVEALGHECTSTWMRNGEDDRMGWPAAALLDVADVRRSHAVIFAGQPQGSANRGGGRWFELGLAFSEGKRMLIITEGGHESVFTMLPEAECHDSWESALETLSPERLAKYPYEDFSSSLVQHHQGTKVCVGLDYTTPGCRQRAGTAWSREWCPRCNMLRMRKIGGALERELARIEGREA